MSQYYGAIEEDRMNDNRISPSSSSLDKKRNPRACDLCRKKKIKCSGSGASEGANGSSCDHCSAQNLECTFVSASKPRGPPKGYVESLEKRIESMELIIRNLSGGANGGASLTNTNSFEDGRESMGLQIRSTESPVSDDSGLAAEMSDLCVDNDRFVGLGSGPHLMAIISERLTKSKSNSLQQDSQTPMQPDQSLSCGGFVTEGSSLVEMLLLNESKAKILSSPLPEPELAQILIDSYFSNLNQNFPLLHRPSFDRAIASGLANSDGSFRSLVFIVLALGCRFVEDSRIPAVDAGQHPNGAGQSRGFIYFNYVSQPMSIQSASLFSLQSSVLSVLWLCGAASPIAAWIACSQAFSRLIDVGAHREFRARWTKSPLENQLRKRAFCQLFGLDRGLSATLGRPVSLQEIEADVKEPEDISDFELDEWNSRGGPRLPPSDPALVTPGPISATNALYRLQKIMGRTFTSLFAARTAPIASTVAAEKVSELDSMLNEWLASVPEHLRWGSEQSSRWLVLQSTLYLTYYSTQSLIHRDFISRPLPTFPSLAICSNASRSSSHIIDILRKEEKLEQLFFSLPLCGATAALILLISVSASTSGQLTSSAFSDVQKCQVALEILSKTTWIASKCAAGISKFSSIALAQVMTESQQKELNSRKRLPEGAPTDPERSSASPSTSSQISYQSPSNSMTTPEEEITNPRVSRTKLTPSTRRPRTSNSYSNDSTLPLSTDQLSLATFNGYSTFSPQSVSNPLADANFAWPTPSSTAIPPPSIPNYDFGVSSGFNIDANYQIPEAGAGIFGNNYQFDFNYSTGLEMNPDMADWTVGNSFDFDAFSQNFL